MLKRPNKPTELVDTAIAYIQIKALPSIFERGRQMANLNNLISGDWNPKAIKIKMKGETGIYTLGFSLQKYKSGRLIDSLEVFCNCPYAQQATNPCKHTVALAFLLRDFSRNFKKIKIENLLGDYQSVEEVIMKTQRNSQVPIVLKARHGAFEYLIEEANLAKQKLDINRLILDFPDEDIHASFFEDDANTNQLAKVTFQKTYAKWTSQCDCAKEVIPFCEHEAQLLALFLIHKPELLHLNHVKNELIFEKAKNIPLQLGILRMIYKLKFANGMISLKYSPNKEANAVLSHEYDPEFIADFDELWEEHKVGELPVVLWKNYYERYFPSFCTAIPKVRTPGDYKNVRTISELCIQRYGLADLDGKFECLRGLDENTKELALYRLLLLNLKQLEQYPQLLALNEGYIGSLTSMQLSFNPVLSYARKEVEDFFIYEIKVNGRKCKGPKSLLRASFNRFFSQEDKVMYLVEPESNYDFLGVFDNEGQCVVTKEGTAAADLESRFAEFGIPKKLTKPKEVLPIADWNLEVYLSQHESKYLRLQVVVSVQWEGQEPINYGFFKTLNLFQQAENEVEFDELKQAFHTITKLHPMLGFQEVDDFMRIPASEPNIPEFLNELMNLAEKNDWRVYGQEIIHQFLKTVQKPQIRTSLFRAEEWFSMKVELKFDQEVVSIKQLLEAWKNGNRFILLKNGARGEIPAEWIKRFSRYFSIAEEKNQQIPKTLGHLIDTDDFSEVSADAFEFIDNLQKKLAQPELDKQKLPKSVKAKLRPYQETSYHWMNQLADLEWGGILADDMGLGKTLQAITFMTKRLDDKKGNHLMIVPKSLLHNWENEWKSFTGKKPYIHAGPERVMDEKELAKKPLIITSYGTLLRDTEVFSKLHFDVLVLDEAQAVKNPATKSRKAVATLKAKVRLAMTGTPVENSLTDLYSILSLAVPGSLGSLKQFQSRFQSDKPGSLELLREMISPFILRRLKSQVATELPEKMVTHRIIDMEEDQAAFYEQTRQHYLERFQKTEEGEWSKNGMLVLKGMNELRQICDAPAMLAGQSGQGAKIRELMYELDELVPHHKVLIFSQYVKMLKLVEHQIKQKGWGYVMLDGSTQKRQELVDRFQEDSSTRIFLISLKAGGSGLNLTEAEYVYILDPWWNPAAEEQAIDRAHRIGQQNKVMAIKFVCKGSIEEKVLEMQSHKKNLADSVISADDTMIKTLDKKKVLELFAQR